MGLASDGGSGAAPGKERRAMPSATSGHGIPPWPGGPGRAHPRRARVQRVGAFAKARLRRDHFMDVRPTSPSSETVPVQKYTLYRADSSSEVSARGLTPMVCMLRVWGDRKPEGHAL